MVQILKLVSGCVVVFTFLINVCATVWHGYRHNVFETDAHTLKPGFPIDNPTFQRTIMDCQRKLSEMLDSVCVTIKGAGTQCGDEGVIDQSSDTDELAPHSSILSISRSVAMSQYAWIETILGNIYFEDVSLTLKKWS